ncbi:hypothetical protein DXG01_009351 [Tephrocybe rancida]|nr:hypothetical protein DXG01_009351 [Tephrocybe rancida]
MSSVNPTEATPLLQVEDGDGVLVLTPKETKTSQEIFREELGLLPRYVLPVLGSQVLEYSMVVTNVISVGHLSTTALAAVSLGSMTAGVTGLSMLHGLASGLETILPAAYTSPNPQLVGLWTQRMGMSVLVRVVWFLTSMSAVVMACALVPVCLIWYNAEPIFLALRQDPEVAHLAAAYLRCMSLALPAVAWNILSRRYFQCQRLFSVQTRIMMFVAPLNALGNYALVWGPETIRLGFIGAPIATMVSYYLVSIASFVYGAYLIPRTAWYPLSMKMFFDLGILVRLGLSGIGDISMVGLGVRDTGYLIHGTNQSRGALHLIHNVFDDIPASVFKCERRGNSAGHLLGENNANSTLTLDTSSSGLLLAQKSWPKLFNEDPAVVSLVSRVLPIIAMYQFIDATAAMGAGFLRVRGMQFIGALTNLCAYFIVGLPLGLWLAFKCDLGLHGLWYGLTMALTINCVFGLVLWSRTDWKEEVLKVAERNSREERRQKTPKIQDEENRR